jgi:hypothetical protein
LPEQDVSISDDIIEEDHHPQDALKVGYDKISIFDKTMHKIQKVLGISNH